jgi:hypothetical protein
VRLRGLSINDISLSDYFVECYEHALGSKLENINFYKDLTAINLASLYGLSPFTANTLESLVKFNPRAVYTFGNFFGKFIRTVKLRRLENHFKSHHSNYNSPLKDYHEYFLQYLEFDRYTQHS